MARKRAPARQELEDGSAVIDLSQPATPEDNVSPNALPDYGAKVADDKPAEINRTILPAPAPEPTVQEPDLASQIEALEKREKRAKERAEAAEQARQQAEYARQTEVARTRVELESTQFDSVANALVARENEVVALTAARRDAMTAGDTARAEEINDKILDAKLDIRTLRDGKVQLERNLEQRKTAPPPPPPQPTGGAAVEAILAQMPQLTNQERDWIRKHPDAIQNPNKVQRLQIAYADAQERGIKRDSAEYFHFFNDRLGYEPEEADYEEDDMPDDDVPQVASPPLQPRQAPERRTPAYAAPVSRSAPGASSREVVNNNKVTLTPIQREAAKISKVSEREYAEGLRKLAERKRQGYYGEQG